MTVSELVDELKGLSGSLPVTVCGEVPLVLCQVRNGRVVRVELQCEDEEER